METPRIDTEANPAALQTDDVKAAVRFIFTALAAGPPRELRTATVSLSPQPIRNP